MSTKLIVGCISGAGALGGAVAGSYYLLNNKEVTDTSKQPNEENRQKAKTPKTLKEALAGTGFIALDTDQRTDDDHWRTLITKYNAGGTSIAKIAITGGLTPNTQDNNLANIKKLQKACSDLFAKKENYENDKETAINWCNKKSTLITSG